MNIFIYDHITGGGLGAQPLPEPLVRRCENIIRALVDDFLRMPAIQLTLWRDARMAELPYSGFDDLRVRQVRVEQYDRRQWEAQVEAVDAVWIVAPETGGLLENLSSSVLRIGKTLLGSSPKAIALCASRAACADALRIAGIDVAQTVRVEEHPDWGFACVLKPDDGMGGHDIWRFPNARAAAEFHARRAFARPMILQEFIEGEAGSISLLCHQGQANLLSINSQQRTVQDNRLGSNGNGVGSFGSRDHRNLQLLRAMADMVVAAIPGLWGFVSIEFVIGPQGPRIIEINPRLTDAYVGLYQQQGINVAEMALEHAPARSTPSSHAPIQPWASSSVDQPALN